MVIILCASLLIASETQLPPAATKFKMTIFKYFHNIYNGIIQYAGKISPQILFSPFSHSYLRVNLKLG